MYLENQNGLQFEMEGVTKNITSAGHLFVTRSLGGELLVIRKSTLIY